MLFTDGDVAQAARGILPVMTAGTEYEGVTWEQAMMKKELGFIITAALSAARGALSRVELKGRPKALSLEPGLKVMPTGVDPEVGASYVLVRYDKEPPTGAAAMTVKKANGE